ncbi:MAG: hypothetical protein OXP37_00665 [Chloroflexota bacterium]|nr:hypothetical protein [Chloroflexota bacterium]
MELEPQPNRAPTFVDARLVFEVDQPFGTVLVKPIGQDPKIAIESIIGFTKLTHVPGEQFPADPLTALNAISLVSATVGIAPTPRVGATIAGDIVIEWAFADNVEVGICISVDEPAVFPATDAAITRSDGVHELQLQELPDLIDVLRRIPLPSD